MDGIWTDERLLPLAVVGLFMSNFMHRVFAWEESLVSTISTKIECLL